MPDLLNRYETGRRTHIVLQIVGPGGCCERRGVRSLPLRAVGNAVVDPAGSEASSRISCTGGDRWRPKANGAPVREVLSAARAEVGPGFGAGGASPLSAPVA